MLIILLPLYEKTLLLNPTKLDIGKEGFNTTSYYVDQPDLRIANRTNTTKSYNNFFFDTTGTRMGLDMEKGICDDIGEEKGYCKSTDTVVPRINVPDINGEKMGIHCPDQKIHIGETGRKMCKANRDYIPVKNITKCSQLDKDTQSDKYGWCLSTSKAIPINTDGTQKYDKNTEKLLFGYENNSLTCNKDSLLTLEECENPCKMNPTSQACFESEFGQITGSGNTDGRQNPIKTQAYTFYKEQHELSGFQNMGANMNPYYPASNHNVNLDVMHELITNGNSTNVFNSLKSFIQSMLNMVVCVITGKKHNYTEGFENELSVSKQIMKDNMDIILSAHGDGPEFPEGEASSYSFYGPWMGGYSTHGGLNVDQDKPTTSKFIVQRIDTTDPNKIVYVVEHGQYTKMVEVYTDGTQKSKYYIGTLSEYDTKKSSAHTATSNYVYNVRHRNSIFWEEYKTAWNNLFGSDTSFEYKGRTYTKLDPCGPNSNFIDVPLSCYQKIFLEVGCNKNGYYPNNYSMVRTIVGVSNTHKLPTLSEFRVALSLHKNKALDDTLSPEERGKSSHICYGHGNGDSYIIEPFTTNNKEEGFVSNNMPNGIRYEYKTNSSHYSLSDKVKKSGAHISSYPLEFYSVPRYHSLTLRGYLKYPKNTSKIIYYIAYDDTVDIRIGNVNALQGRNNHNVKAGWTRPFEHCCGNGSHKTHGECKRIFKLQELVIPEGKDPTTISHYVEATATNGGGAGRLIIRRVLYNSDGDIIDEDGKVRSISTTDHKCNAMKIPLRHVYHNTVSYNNCDWTMTAKGTRYGGDYVRKFTGDCDNSFSFQSVPDYVYGGSCQRRYRLLNGVITDKYGNLVGTTSCTNQRFYWKKRPTKI